MKKYRILQPGEVTDKKLGDEFQFSPNEWIATEREGRHIHDGLVGAYRRPIKPTKKAKKQ